MFPLWGRLADRTAAPRVISLALGLMTVTGVAVALAPSEGLLIVARALQGAAAAGVPPAAQAALAQSSAEHETGRAMSPMMLAVARALPPGPMIATVLGDAAGWTVAALAVGCALPLVLLAVSWRSAAAAQASTAMSSARVARYADARGVRAGWIVSACV